MKADTTIMFRPVGPKELELIRASGFREFPPRLPEQPIFYPVLNEEYANDISRKWNVKDYGVGYRYWADGGDGSGRNRLGELLMELRTTFRNAAD